MLNVDGSYKSNMLLPIFLSLPEIPVSATRTRVCSHHSLCVCVLVSSVFIVQFMCLHTILEKKKTVAFDRQCFMVGFESFQFREFSSDDFEFII